MIFRLGRDPRIPDGFHWSRKKRPIDEVQRNKSFLTWRFLQSHRLSQTLGYCNKSHIGTDSQIHTYAKGEVGIRNSRGCAPNSDGQRVQHMNTGRD
jgi:hypothetical protein